MLLLVVSAAWCGKEDLLSDPQVPVGNTTTAVFGLKIRKRPSFSASTAKDKFYQ